MAKFHGLPIAIWVALITAVGSAIGNIDRIGVFISTMQQDPQPASGIDGKWTGLFTEYSHSSNSETISSEAVDLKTSGNTITGTLETTDQLIRRRQATGEFQYGFLVLSFLGQDETRVGGATYFLQGQPANGLLKGYWLGYDPEQRKLMASPYVLTRQQDIERVKTEQSEWLKQRCYPQPPVSDQRS